MDEADTAVPAVQVLPIRDAGSSGGDGTGHAGLQREVGGPCGAAIPQQAGGGEEVKAERQGPSPNRDRHGNGMHRMAIGTAMQRVGEHLARPAADLPGAGDGLAERVARPVEAFSGLNLADRRVDHLTHEGTPSDMPAR